MTDETAETADVGTRPRGAFLFDSWFGRWFVQRLPAALVWFWFALRFLNIPLPVASDVSREILLIPALVAAVLMLAFGRFARLVAYPLYILFFPILLLWLGARFLNMPFRLSRYAVSARGTLLLFIVIISCWVAASVVDDVVVSAVLFLSGQVILYGTFLRSVPWAANPYSPLVNVIGFVSEKARDIIGRAFVSQAVEGSLEGSSESAVRICEWGIKAINYLSPPEDPYQGGITGFTYKQLLPFTIYGFGLVYLILAASFSIALKQIELAWGMQIRGIGVNRTFLDYFYFSFLSQATAVPDNIQPVTTAGQFWLIWLVLTGIIFLTVLVSMFTTSIGVHSESAVNQMQTYLQQTRSQLEEWKSMLTERNIEHYNGVLEGEIASSETSKEHE